MNKTEQSQNALISSSKLFPDINAQQFAIITQFIPNQFYDNNSDAVQVTFNLLPNGTDPHFVDEANLLEQKFISAVDIVSKNLTFQLQAKYLDVLKAMNLISDLNNQLNLSTQNISILRQILQKADSEICQNPENFFHQIQKQKNLKSVLDLLDLVKQIRESSEKINQALQKNDFVLAITLCFKPSELSSKVQNLTGVERLISSLQNTYSRITDKMDTALVSQTIAFNHIIYDNLINAYDQLNQLKLVPQKLQEAFLTRLKAEFDSIIDNEEYKNFTIFKEIVNSFVNFSKSLLSTYQQIVSYHRISSKSSLIHSSIEKMIEIIWISIEDDLSIILKKIPIQKMNFDGFNNVLNILNDFKQFSATIVDITSNFLDESIYNIGSNYLKYFHQIALEAILENIELDTWVVIPTNTDFERQILTFKFINSFSHNMSVPQLSQNTNSCIAIIKYIHQYITILNSVPSLSVEIIQFIRELVEYYSFSILNIFLQYSSIKPFEFDQKKLYFSLRESSVLFPNNGIQLIMRIVHHFINRSQQLTFPLKLSIEDNDKLNFEKILITAKNNMDSISWYLQSIRNILEDSLPLSSIGSFHRFYTDFVANFLDKFALFLFQFIIPKIVDISSFEQQMKEIRFNKNDECGEQHQFSKTWISITENFIIKLNNDVLNEIDKDLLLKAFWIYSSFISINNLASLTALLPKEKSLLIVDFKMMSQYLKKIINIDSDWIIEYINASLLKKNEFISWAENNFNKYTFYQLSAIVDTGLADKINKKEKAQIQEKIKKLFKDLN